jgi:hypothetical protein
MFLGDRPAHHAEHRDAAALAEIAHDQHGCERQKDDVQNGRGVEAHGGLGDLGVPRAGGDEAERVEDQIDDSPGPGMPSDCPSRITSTRPCSIT